MASRRPAAGHSELVELVGEFCPILFYSLLFLNVFRLFLCFALQLNPRARARQSHTGGAHAASMESSCAFRRPLKMHRIHVALTLIVAFVVSFGRLATAYDPTPVSSVSPFPSRTSRGGLSDNEMHTESSSSAVAVLQALRGRSGRGKHLSVLFHASVLVVTLAMTFVVLQCFRILLPASSAAVKARVLSTGDDSRNSCEVRDRIASHQTNSTEYTVVGRGPQLAQYLLHARPRFLGSCGRGRRSRRELGEFCFAQ